MKTLFFLGLGSWIIHVLSTGLSYSLFNRIKEQLNNPANLPLWYHALTWIINLSSLAYWISTILIFFSFKSSIFMIAVVLVIVILAVIAKLRNPNKVLAKVTEEEIAGFTLSFKTILTLWSLALVIFLFGATPYLLLFLFAL